MGTLGDLKNDPVVYYSLKVTFPVPKKKRVLLVFALEFFFLSTGLILIKNAKDLQTKFYIVKPNNGS